MHPRRLYLTLTNPKQRLYIETKLEPRSDVNDHFNQPKMADSGFLADADVSKLTGEYKLGIARLYKGKLDSCSQLQIPLRFSR